MLSSTQSQLQNWLALYHTPGIGPGKFKEILNKDPTLQKLPDSIKPDWLGVERDLAWLQRFPDANIITLNSDYYPRMLQEIDSPPPILYTRGDISLLGMPQLAIVGSRSPTNLGSQTAELFARHFASLGIIITSGLALGIDGASHEGALSSPGAKTIAVLGSGLDTIYPPRHKELAARIVANGCLVSEFPIGMPPAAWNFPRRNRIISGLSHGVIVVEAAMNSGSLITANLAAEQGREVFAIPGQINNIKAKGCHHLIRQGAKLVDCPEDVLEELGDLMKNAIRAKTAPAGQIKLLNVQLTEPQQLLLNKIDYDSTCVDVIVRRTGMDIRTVGAILLELELLGLISSVPGGFARRLGIVTVN